MKRPKSDYEKLRDAWYKKLKDKGFCDIERDEDSLKIWSTRFNIYHTPEQAQAKSAYYIMAEHFLNEHKFSSRLEKSMWEYHVHGISIRDITTTLNRVKLKTSRAKVWQTINRLSEIMKARYLNKGQDD